MSPIFRFVLVVFLGFVSFGAQAQGLFVDLPAGTPAMAGDAVSVDAIPGTVKRSRLVGLDTAYLDALRPAARKAGDPSPAAAITFPPILLNLFPDMPPVQLNVTAEEILADGRLVWRGQPEGVTGFVNLVINGIQVTGVMQIGDQTIEIRPSRFNLHRVIEIDTSRFPSEGRAMQPPTPQGAPAGPTGRPMAPRSAPDRAAADGNTTLNVLAVYSSRSVTASSDIVSEIQLAVTTSNTIYTNSGIPITLNLVGTQLMSDYSETSRSYENVLNDLTGTSDGRMDTVHALRTALQADLVVYFTERSEYCGLAWLYNRYPQYGFSVVTRSCATSNMTFPHELGHNMGAEHDRYVVSDASSSAYNYGYVDTTARIRTVMAYNDACVALGFNCTRVPYFSSPYLTYNGTALGVNPWSTSAAYNARALTENASGIAGFRNGSVASIRPASGWWWNASEGGRGYSIEISGSTMFFALYTYAADGTALWYISSGLMTDSTTYSGVLQQYAGGQTLNGSYQAATPIGSVGTIQIYFDAANSGTIVFPNGSSTSITRFDFTTNGAVGGTAPGYPQTGWWWNASEGGRGFFVEAQNTAMFVSFYMYNSAGQAVWYVASGSMISSTVFQGTIQEYSGGSALTDSFRAPTGTSNAGTVTIQFGTTTTATMTLPNGSQVPLTRFAF
jgi:hypothetical protein